MEWQVVEARKKLSHILALAHSEGPQFITKRGDRDAVLISIDMYEGLRPAKSFKDMLRAFPKAENEDAEDVFAREGNKRDLPF